MFHFHMHTHTRVQTSKEVGILREFCDELHSEIQQVQNLTEEVATLPDDIFYKHLFLLIVQSAVVMAVFLLSCLWVSHMNRHLEQKISSIQSTLSTQNHLVRSQIQLVSSIGVTAGDSKSFNDKRIKDYDSEHLRYQRTSPLSCCHSQSSSATLSHGRSLSLSSVADLQRQAENIGPSVDTSRADLKLLTTKRSKSWQADGSKKTNGEERETVTTACSSGSLASHSLTCLGVRKSTDEVSPCCTC